jgi:hypothetical protein
VLVVWGSRDNVATDTTGTFSVRISAPAGLSSAETAPIPPWVQAYGRFGKDAPCDNNWGPSWQLWAEKITSGWVCTRTIPGLG